MPDWDDNSPQLHKNLTSLLSGLRDEARARSPLSLEEARKWHVEMLTGLTPPNPRFVGRFRGEGGVNVQVRVGSNLGTPPYDVAGELGKFEKTLNILVDKLDRDLEVGAVPTDNQIDAIVAACGWVHSEWVRIHPFVNGNGRTARIWANAIAMRYGLPPFVRLRPRPDGSKYGLAGAAAMLGDYNPTVEHFREMLDKLLSQKPKK